MKFSVLLFIPGLFIAAALPAGWPVAALAQTRPSVPLVPTPHQEISTLIKAEKFPQALEKIDVLLAQSPRDAQARFIRTVVLTHMGQTAEAMTGLEAMTREFPELPEPHNNLAVLLAQQGRYEQARSALQRALAAAPNYVTAYENLGDLYVAMAADSYRQASELDSKSTTLQTKLKQARELQTQMRPASSPTPTPTPTSSPTPR